MMIDATTTVKEALGLERSPSLKLHAMPIDVLVKNDVVVIFIKGKSHVIPIADAKLLHAMLVDLGVHYD